ncbi:MAG: hypothetical protein ABSB49_05410 [Polyangia bacterium]
MRKPAAEPTRLSALPESEDYLGIGHMFRAARELPDEELSALRWRLRTSQRRRDVRPHLLAKVTLVLGGVFCLGGVVGAVVSPFRAAKEEAVAPGPTPLAAPAARRRRAVPTTSAPVAPGPSEPLPEQLACSLDEARPVRSAPGSVLNEDGGGLAEPASAPDRAELGQPTCILNESEGELSEPELHANQPQPQPIPARHRASTVATLDQPTPPPTIGRPATIASPPVAPSRIAAEQALLTRAMTTLREGRNAGAALVLLAQHAERFPDGAFADEATALRIEALLALGRRGEALSLLDQVALAALPDHNERLVMRGELRAASGRWQEAEQDFDAVLQDRHLGGSAKARSVQERALWGRAVARGRRGDKTGARADLESYLRIFPTGRFASDAGALLKEEQ